MITRDKLSEWIDQWTSQTNKVLNDLEEMDQIDFQSREKNREKYDQQYEELKSRLRNLLTQFTENLRRFHSDTKEIAQKEPQIKAVREIIYAAFEVIHKIPFYSEGFENEIVLGIQNFLLSLRSALSGRWEEPTSSILELDLDPVISKYLFYLNGVVTIGQLVKAINADEKLQMIGSVRWLKIQTALIGMQTKRSDHNNISPDASNDLESGSYGLWKLMTGEKPLFFIELNGAQALIIANYCSIRILPDGKVLARLADC